MFYVIDNSAIHTSIDIPADAKTITGNCDESEQYITLAWLNIHSNKSSTLNLEFYLNSTTNYYTLNRIEVNLDGNFIQNGLG